MKAYNSCEGSILDFSFELFTYTHSLLFILNQSCIAESQVVFKKLQVSPSDTYWKMIDIMPR